MGYLTFDEYKEKGGSLDSAAFSKSLPFAEAKLNSMTPLEQHPLTVTDGVKQATTFLIDNYAVRYATAEKKEKIASFSNDGVSVSYAAITAADEERELFNVVHILLPYETRLGVRMRC